MRLAWAKPALACALGAAATVAGLAALLPRRYMVNDDQTITAFLRANTLAPFVQPALSQALGAFYAALPQWPWYGLWLYLAYAATLALAARLLLEEPEEAPVGLQRTLATGALLVGAGIALLATRITFTTAAIGACGVGLVGFLAETLREAEGRRARGGRVFACGLVLAAGLLTRFDGLLAAGVASFPLLAAAAARALRARRLPGGARLAAFLGPALVLLAVGHALPQWRDPEAQRFLAFNAERGALQLRAAFASLTERAPDVLRAAGWDAARYRRFERWVYLDEDWYTTERLRALRDTGGRPRDLRVAEAATHARVSAGYAFPLLLAAIAAAAALPLSGLGRARALVLALAHLTVLAWAAQLLQRWLRLPARVAMPMCLVAALAVWVTVRADCDLESWRTAGRILRARPRRAAAAALGLAAAVAFAVQALVQAVPREVPVPAERAALDRGLRDRRPTLVVVHAQAGWNRDPLRAEPRDYPALSLDWDIFSVPFYRSLARVGARRGKDLASRLAGREDAFVLCEGRFLGDLARMVAQDAPGAKMLALERTGPTPDDLVLARVAGPEPERGPEGPPPE